MKPTVEVFPGLHVTSIDEADHMFKECEKLEFVRPSKLHRSVQIFSDTAPGYFTTRVAESMDRALPMPIFLRDWLATINTVFHEKFNLLVVNKFANGNEGVYRHADTYGHGDHCIVTLSLGASRQFSLVSMWKREICYTRDTQHGEVVVMDNPLQKTHMHEIPEEPELKCGTRYSITARWVRDDDPNFERMRLQVRACIMCKKSTVIRKQVCVACMEKKLFTCACGEKTALPWPCDTCYAKETADKK